MSLTDGNIDLYSGNDDQIVPLLSLGAKGVISVLSNVAPKETHDICAKFFEGDVKGSLDLQLKAIPLIEKLFCELNHFIYSCKEYFVFPNNCTSAHG